MASFTDTQLPKFNPYIQQQPVEAMVAVGTGKQKAHDEGVQKIQTQIDNIAGLDVVRDVDKAYLQSKINELGNSLRTVAAGDFSNFQLVNSVGGMTKQIVQDKNVQNAVSSAAKYRKELGYLEKDVADGKENPANTAHFNKHSSKWLNSSELDQSYNVKYVTPKDVWGKIKDIAKEVGVDEQTVQQLYQTDENGNYMLDANKKPIWNKIMVEKTLKGKDAGKILKAFETGLTPADYQQLNINGEYQNSGLDSNALKQRIMVDSKEQTDFNDKKLLDLNTALLQEIQKNDKDEERIKSINDQIEYFEGNNDKVKSSLERNLKIADENPDFVRGSLYTNDYLHTMSKSLSSQDVSTKYSVSPMFEITMKENEFNRQIQRDKIADYHWSVEQTNAALKDQADREFKALELFAKTGVKSEYLKLPPGFTGVNTGERLNEPIPEIQKADIKNVVEDQYSTSVADLNETNYNLTLQYFKEINKDKRPVGEDEVAYDRRMRQAIDKFATGNKEQAANFGTGKINTFTARFAAKQLEDWKVNPKNVPQEFRSLISKQNNLSQELETQRQDIKEVKADALRIAKERGVDVPNPQEIEANIKPTTVRVHTGERALAGINGQTFNLSKQDVADYASIHPEFYNFFGDWSVDKGQSAAKAQAEKRLQLKYGDNYKLLDNYLHQIREMGTGAWNMEKGSRGQTNPVIRKAGEFINSRNYKVLSDIESDLYVKRGVVKQPSSVTLYRGEEKPEDFSARISGVVSKYNLDGKILSSAGLTSADVQKAILGKDEKAVKVISFPGVGSAPATHMMRITGPDGKTLELNIDNDDYRILTRTDPPENVGIPRVAKKLNAHGTTNSSGNPKGAHWSSDKFTRFNSKKYNITGDLVIDSSIPDVAHMKVYLYDKTRPHDAPRVVTIPAPIQMKNPDGSYDNILDYLPAGVTESNIEQFIKQ